MMSLPEILELHAHPERMSERTLVSLRETVDAYPAFHAARILLVLNRLCLGNADEKALRASSMYLPCRRELKDMMENAMARRQDGLLAQDRTMNLLNAFLGDGGDESISSLLAGSAVSEDYLAASGLSADDVSTPAGADNIARTRTDDLLDAFLASSDSEGTVAVEADVVRPEEESVPDDESSTTIALNGEMFTETLAGIYIKQHRYEEAIEIIRVLCLNFPNKSSYFADQIRYLEKLVKVNKQKDN